MANWIMQGNRTHQCVKQPGSVCCGKIAAAKNSLDAHVTAEFLDFVARSHGEAFGSGGRDLAELKRHVEADREALRDLARARYVTRTIGEDEFVAARQGVMASLADLEPRLAVMQQAAATASGLPPAGDRDALQAWWDAADLPERRAALRAALTEVRVNPARHRGGNVFDTSRVELRWRLTFAAEMWRSSPPEQRERARLADEAEANEAV
jgi:hypothetical protein